MEKNLLTCDENVKMHIFTKQNYYINKENRMSASTRD